MLCSLFMMLATGTAALGAALPIMRPLRFDDFWLLLMLPLVVGISVTYKAIKLEDLATLPREATLMAVQIVVFMVVAAVVIFAVTHVT